MRYRTEELIRLKNELGAALARAEQLQKDLDELRASYEDLAKKIGAAVVPSDQMAR